MALLRAFRLGVTVLTNAELSLRTGLPRPTVSRLSRSLVDGGFLAYDHDQNGYRLSSICLSLALSFRTANRALDIALPLMRGLAEGRKINVGLAVLDGTEMVYLDSVRLSRLGVFRRLVAGSRIPAAHTALGRAYLAKMPTTERNSVMKKLAVEEGSRWPAVQREIQAAMRCVKQDGYCWAYWQPSIVAIAAPIQEPTGRRYALNVSMPAVGSPYEDSVESYGVLLRSLADSIEERWRVEQL
jgi:DNA-binding IclR family transcriptional regulator